MNNTAFLSVEIGECRRQQHKFKIAGSDKTPLKRNLICVTCTEANPGRTAYAAYGDETKSSGPWRDVRFQQEDL